MKLYDSRSYYQKRLYFLFSPNEFCLSMWPFQGHAMKFINQRGIILIIITTRLNNNMLYGDDIAMNEI